MSRLLRVLPVRGASPYEVLIGRGIATEVPRLLGADVRRVAVIAAAELAQLALPVVEALRAAGLEVHVLEVPEGEAAKTVEVAARAWEQLGAHGFTRSDAVVTVGGGTVTDMGGFIAATWLRGVKVVHVPTTLLAMVDAAVGGKTGMNTAAGKNLVGSFHEPAGVLVDLDTLETLPRAESISGMAEVIKCGFIADPEILALVEADPQRALRLDEPVLAELIERAIAVKIDVVVDDLTERGGAEGHPGREVLNYGHTLAHAIERAEDYTMRHGEAVAIGCVFAAELARRIGVLDDATADRHAAVFASIGLPVSYAGASFEELRRTMAVDKKSRGATLRFVLLDALARPRVYAAPDEAALEQAYAVVSEGPR